MQVTFYRTILLWFSGNKIILFNNNLFVLILIMMALFSKTLKHICIVYHFIKLQERG